MNYKQIILIVLISLLIITGITLYFTLLYCPSGKEKKCNNRCVSICNQTQKYLCNIDKCCDNDHIYKDENGIEQCCDEKLSYCDGKLGCFKKCKDGSNVICNTNECCDNDHIFINNDTKQNYCCSDEQLCKSLDGKGLCCPEGTHCDSKNGTCIKCDNWCKDKCCVDPETTCVENECCPNTRIDSDKKCCSGINTVLDKNKKCCKMDQLDKNNVCCNDPTKSLDKDGNCILINNTYKCSLDGKCIEDSTGKYKNLFDCKNVCIPSQSSAKVDGTLCLTYGGNSDICNHNCSYFGDDAIIAKNICNNMASQRTTPGQSIQSNLPDYNHYDWSCGPEFDSNGNVVCQDDKTNNVNCSCSGKIKDSSIYK